MKFYIIDNKITPEHDIAKDINTDILKQVYPQSESDNNPNHKMIISNTENYILVKVGENDSHPMDEDEHIEFIMLEINDKIVNTIYLNINGEPNAIFNLDINKNNLVGTNVKIYAYCNKTGLWEKTYLIV